jgi:hypothetical protein
MSITAIWQNEPKQPRSKLWEFLVTERMAFKKRPCEILSQIITKKCYKNMEILPNKDSLISVTAKIRKAKLLRNLFH